MDIIPSLRVKRVAPPRKKREKSTTTTTEQLYEAQDEDEDSGTDTNGSTDESEDEDSVVATEDPWSDNALAKLRELGWPCIVNSKGIYEVERVVGSRPKASTKIDEYLVQWVGWPPYEPYAYWRTKAQENGEYKTSIENYTKLDTKPYVEKPGERRQGSPDTGVAIQSGSADTVEDDTKLSDKPKRAFTKGEVEVTAFEADLWAPGVYGTNEYAVAREACQRVGADWVIAG